jgi:hypothetical protein
VFFLGGSLELSQLQFRNGWIDLVDVMMLLQLLQLLWRIMIPACNSVKDMVWGNGYLSSAKVEEIDSIQGCGEGGILL